MGSVDITRLANLGEFSVGVNLIRDSWMGDALGNKPEWVLKVSVYQRSPAPDKPFQRTYRVRILPGRDYVLEAVPIE
jgi:hypothetical protein